MLYLKQQYNGGTGFEICIQLFEGKISHSYVLIFGRSKFYSNLFTDLSFLCSIYRYLILFYMYEFIFPRHRCLMTYETKSFKNLHLQHSLACRQCLPGHFV